MNPEKSRGRILMIGLDGFELSLAETMMAEGNLPNFARLRSQSARYLLDHGRDKYSGISWEHVSTGLSPTDGGRWSSVSFDPVSYGVHQETTSMTPFVADASGQTVVFDVPYFDLARAPRVRGMTNWGAHDPGVPTTSRPAGLQDELRERFGPYPATDWIYGFSWPSVEKTRTLSDALVRAVETRARAARWMFGERLPDWNLAMVVIAECHSVIEPLWHGVDPAHPLHGIASAPAAADGVRRVYRAIDGLVGDLCDAFPDATVVLFSMHGMGANGADVASMVLLPELLYRHAFGRSYIRPGPWSRHLPDGTPILDEDMQWDAAMLQAVPPYDDSRQSWLRRLRDRIGGPPAAAEARDPAEGPRSLPIDWMPVARYRPFWRRMQAFAIPAFYDGRVRINLVGRESRGTVPRSRYRAVCREIVDLLHECRNSLTGEPIVDQIYWDEKDPGDVKPSEADIYIVWRPALLGLRHPTLGTIGPIPYRRTGGHTGDHGFMFVAGAGVTPRDAGLASSFDVVPSVLDLLGEQPLQKGSGRSLAGEIRAAA